MASNFNMPRSWLWLRSGTAYAGCVHRCASVTKHYNWYWPI